MLPIRNNPRFVLALLLPLLALFNGSLASTLFYQRDFRSKPISNDACAISLVETIPDNLTFPNSSVPQHVTTYAAYQFLVGAAVQELKIASFYWTLRGSDINMTDPGHLAANGEQLLAALVKRASKVPIRIANNIGGFSFNSSDLDLMSQLPNVGLVWVNISGLMGSGVQHAKLMSADGRHAYLGSSNIDWRSLNQVKELGFLFNGCPAVVKELEKVFEIYWLVGRLNRIPTAWPANLSAAYNATNPWLASVGGFKYAIFVGVSPAPLAPPDWSRDIDSIVRSILSARKFVHIAVMDYEAATQIGHSRQFWGVIDSAVRTAAFNGVAIKLLVSHWNNSSAFIQDFLYSLTALNSKGVRIEGKFFIVPTYTEDQRRIPFARVNHNKYMVTEDTGIVCTSNWEGSYFQFTSGIAVTVKQLASPPRRSHSGDVSIVEQLQAVFDRDWSSQYAHSRLPPAYNDFW